MEAAAPATSPTTPVLPPLLLPVLPPLVLPLLVPPFVAAVVDEGRFAACTHAPAREVAAAERSGQGAHTGLIEGAAQTSLLQLDDLIRRLRGRKEADEDRRAVQLGTVTW